MYFQLLGPLVESGGLGSVPCQNKRWQLIHIDILPTNNIRYMDLVDHGDPVVLVKFSLFLATSV